jgi:cell division protein FtsZ
MHNFKEDIKMNNMLKFDLPKGQSASIKVLGVGGGGNNAVNHMYKEGIKDVDFIQCNTDAQVLEISPVPIRIQLGSTGLGAGARPEVGRRAAEESIEEIRNLLEKNTQMLFITAGMGGGTGTGAAPVIASIARELDILTVGIVTLPFSFEGRKRRLQAEQGIEELRKYVDTLLIINNDKVRELFGDLKLTEAFHHADNILSTAAKGIAEIITVKGYINVDFEDVKTVMKNSGKAIMGSGLASGEDRAIKAASQALSSPLLNDNDINGAKNMLLYISSGVEGEITMDEVSEITDYIQQSAGLDVDIIWGTGFDEVLGDQISITLIATGFEAKRVPVEDPIKKNIIPLNDEVATKATFQPQQAESIIREEISLINRVERIESFQAPEPQTDTIVMQEVEMIQPQKATPVHTDPITEITLFSRPELEITNEIEVKPNQKPEHHLLTKIGTQNRPMEFDNTERRRKFNRFSVTPDMVDNYEKVPAYKRNGYELTQTPPASAQISNKLVLNEDNEVRNNPFLEKGSVD